MSHAKEVATNIEDGYNEEEDSDFDAASVDQGSSASDDEGDDEAQRSRVKRRKVSHEAKAQEEPVHLDSGDEATIRERKKEKRRSRKKGLAIDDSDDEDTGWKAKTRSMREREREEQHQRRLASTKESTADIDQIFRDMQSSDTSYDVAYLNALKSSRESALTNGRKDRPQEDSGSLEASEPTIGNTSSPPDMIDITLTSRYAGETHTHVKSVPRDSEEGRAYLANQAKDRNNAITNADGVRSNEKGLPLRRPLRKVSKFDPNINDPESFKKNWEKTLVQAQGGGGPKINTVEKSRRDWVTHVDQAGLQEELTEHSRGKANYMDQRDFLDRVDNVREEEARRARLSQV